MLARWLCRQRSYRLRLPSSQFSTSKRCYATASTLAGDPAVDRTRNIGIIAHIDAGKTTTTERMLYYSGFSRRIGDVDDGSTVTDFLPAERARGITIQSAAITFNWPPSPPSLSPSTSTSVIPQHSINLIDTPGHADFTFEVIRSLRVLDGAVCILDGVAGVEAQTEKVWTQAQSYAIPRLIFVNKLDRDGAAFAKTVKEVGLRLGVWPAVCQIPWWDGEGRLVGVGDAVELRGMRWKDGGDGKEFVTSPLDELKVLDQALSGELVKARTALVELLSEHDDVMVDKFLEADEDHLAILPEDVTASLRRCLQQHPQPVAPIFAGASFRNIGVQPLLDSIAALLPAPTERPDPEISFGNTSSPSDTLNAFLTGTLNAPNVKHSTKSLSKDKSPTALTNIGACALAFKVVTDPRRGVLVYIRVYSGTLTKNALLWNTNLALSERSQRLLRMYANDALDIDSISAGNIGVLPGLKHTRTGDTLVAYTGTNPKTGPSGPVRDLHLKPIDVPPPVFFVSVEPNSLAEERHVQDALALLLREDPSLSVALDEESGQTHLAGMGELHLEIARDRLVTDLKAKARIGAVEIGYRETLTTAAGPVAETYDREVGGKAAKARCTATVAPIDLTPSPPSESGVEGKETGVHTFSLPDANTLIITTPSLSPSGLPLTPDSPPLPAHIPLPTLLQALQTGVAASLARGPVHTYPLHSLHIHLTLDVATDLFPTTTPGAVSSAARLAVQRAAKVSVEGGESVLMEPVMRVAIGVDEGSLGSVVHDLSAARGGTVLSLDSEGSETGGNAGPVIDVGRIYTPPDPFSSGAGSGGGEEGGQGGTIMRTVTARVPLKEMVGYLKHLRSLTKGRGTFTMAVDQFERMGAQRMKVMLGEMRGEGW